MSKTFVIIKPDAQERGLVGEILKKFEQRYLRIIGLQLRWKSEAWAKNHYFHLHGEVLDRNIKFMTSAPLIGLVLNGPDAINIVRTMIGSTFDPVPGTIRGDFQTYLPFNLIHASDSEESCINEIKAFFNTATDRVHASNSRE